MMADEEEDEALFPPLQPNNTDTPDPGREDTWKDWPSLWKKPPYETKILHGLASNSFSNIDTNRLPVELPKIVQLAETSGGKFTDEALCFSIIAGNYTLVEEIASNQTFRNTTGMAINLSVTYCSGSTACCNIINAILRNSI
jgi:hypothetical protein